MFSSRLALSAHSWKGGTSWETQQNQKEGRAPQPQADGIIGKEELFLQDCAQAPGCGPCPSEPFLPSFLEGSQNKQELVGNTGGPTDRGMGGWGCGINLGDENSVGLECQSSSACPPPSPAQFYHLQKENDKPAPPSVLGPSESSK